MLIIDRFEENIAVVENGDEEKMLHIERNLIDESAKEGDVIFFSDGSYKVDKDATEKRRAEMIELLKKLNIRKS